MNIKHEGLGFDGLGIGVMKLEPKVKLSACWKMFVGVQIYPADAEV